MNACVLTRLSTYGFVAAVLMTAPAGVLHATILTFDQIREAGVVVPTISGRAVPQDYGDRVTESPMDVSGGQFTYGNEGEGFTPNIIVDYFTGFATPNNPGVSVWEDGYGDLVNVIFGNQNSGSLSIRLVADPGFEVILYDFDLAGWPDADYTISGVRVLDGASLLYAQSDILVEGDLAGDRHTFLDFTTPLTGSQLLIEIDYSNLAAGQQDNIGIDNVRFGQTPPPDPTSPIPAPSTPMLLIAALGGLILSRAGSAIWKGRA